MKTTKKALSLLLAVLMIMSSMSVCFGTVSFAAATGVSEAQWNTLASALANDTVKGATFTGSAHDYTVDDPDGKIIVAIEAYYAVFNALADRSPSGSSAGNRTINQVNSSIKSQMSSRMGSNYSTYGVDAFLTGLLAGANVTAKGAQQSTAETTSSTGTAPGANWSAPGAIKLTVNLSNALTGYTLENLPDTVSATKSFTVTHKNDKYDYTSTKRTVTEGSGCNKKDVTYYTHKYTYYTYISATVSGVAGSGGTSTQTIKDAQTTLEKYKDYFSYDLATLVSKGSATLETVKTDVTATKKNVVDEFGATVFKHFFSDYDVDALNTNITNAKEIITYTPIANEIENLAATDYSAYTYDQLSDLYNTLNTKINSYKPGAVAANYIATAETFDLTAAKNELIAIDKEIKLIEIRNIKADADAHMATYNAYTTEQIDEGTVTTAMINAAKTTIAADVSKLKAYNQSYVTEVCGSNYYNTLAACSSYLDTLATASGYNDRFAAEYAKFASQIIKATDVTADTTTLRNGLMSYDSWYTGLKALIDEMRTELGDELADALFDDLNDEMIAHMDSAYAALNTRIEAQINTAYVLFDAYVKAHGDKVHLLSVAEYEAMQNSIGLIDTTAYNFLVNTKHFTVSDDAVAKYTAMQKKFPQYQQFLDSKGFATFQTSTVPDLVRPDTEKDIARENENGVYTTKDEDIEKIIELLDSALNNAEVKKLLGNLINKDKETGEPTGEAFALGSLVENLLNESVYTDSLINTIVQYIYPIVCKEFAKVWAGLPETFTIRNVQTGLWYAPTADVENCPLYLWDVEEAIASVGIYLAPSTLAANLKGNAAYKGYTDVIATLEAVKTRAVYNKDTDEFTNPWEDSALFETVYEKNEDGTFKLDENNNKIAVLDDEGNPKQVYKLNWGVDEATDKRAAFVDAACAALSGLEPLLFAILANKAYENPDTDFGKGSKDPRGSKIGTGKGSVTVQGLGFLPIDLNLTIDPITLVFKCTANDGWDNALAPIFEALGLTGVPHGEELNTTRKFLENGLLAMIDKIVAQLNTNPVTFVLNAIPNLAYALELGLVEPLLDMLKTDITYYADAYYDAGGVSQDCLKEAMKSDEPIKINIGEMISLEDMGLDISSFQAIWDMLAESVELLNGISAPDASYIATLGKVVERDTVRSAKNYTYGAAGKAAYIEANKADVLVYLLKYVLGSGLIDGLVKNPEGAVADILANLGEKPDVIIAAIVELLNQKEYDTLRNFEWFNGVINDETVVGNSAYEIYMNPNNDWTKEKAEYLYNNLGAIVDAILALAKIDLDKDTPEVETLAGFISALIGDLLSDKTLTSLAALLAKLDLNTLLAPKADEETESEVETVAEGEEATEEKTAPAIDVNALVKEFLGIDLAAVAAQYADIATALEADKEYVYDFGVDAADDKATKFVDELVEMLAPLSSVLDFILEGENLVITIEGKKVELVGYDSYNNAIIPLLEALGCDVKALGEDDDALKVVLETLVAKINAITSDPVNGIIDLLPGVFYFIASKGLSVSVRNILQPVYVILDTIRPIYDLDLNETINGLLPEDFGIMLNIDDIGLDFVFDLLKKFLPDLDLSALKDVIYDICNETATEYTSASTLQTEWKKGAYTADFDQADLLTVVLSFLLEWASVPANGAALDEMLGTNGIVENINKVFEDVEITYGTPDWYYWFESEDAFNDYLAGNAELPNTLAALTYPNDWSEESAKYIADNLASLVDMIIGLIEINGKKYDSVSALLNDLVYGDFNITVKAADEENEAIVINYLFSDETINALLGLLKGILANIDDVLLGAGYILDVDVVGLKNYTCTKDITTIDGFFAELAYVLDTYAKGLVDLLFFGDDFRIAKKSDNTDTIVINGGLGYEKGLALILEALGCTLPEEATVESILGALADRVEAILANPVNEIIDLLPNLVYFLNANGASVAVNNLLAPVYALIDKINGLGVLEEPIDLAALLGFDLKYLSLADILALVKDKAGLDLKAAEEILVNLCFGKIEKAEYTYKMVADRADVVTVVLTTALMLVKDEAFAAKLEELLGNDLITAIATVFESAPVTYKTPDWYALNEEDVDYDNATVGVIKYAITYPNNWTEESAKYVADNLVAIGDMVAGIIDSKYDSLGALLGDKVDIYTPDLLKSIQKLLGDLIGGLDEDLKDIVNVGLGAADELLGADVNGLLNYDVSGVKDKETFVAALTGMLMEVEGLVDWLLFGEDYKFFVDNNKNDIITINGGQGYAEGLALVLEAIGVANLPDVYAMETIDTKAVVSAVLTATFDRVDAILAAPVKEVFDILPNVLYFINANGLTVAVDNLLGAINALLIKLEGLGVELDIASLVNFSEILGVETELALDNLSMKAIVALVAELTGLNLDKVADVLVGFALGRVAAYDSVSSADVTAKMYYHDDFAKYDMITVLATVAIITLADEANADKVKELVGEEVYQVILNLLNMGEVEMQEFDWQFTTEELGGNRVGETFSAFETSIEFAGEVYGEIYTEEMSQYIADNFGEFVNDIIYLLGLDVDGDGKSEVDLTSLINGLINGNLYNSANVITVRDALAGILAKISELKVNDKVVGGLIADILKKTEIADINAVANVKVEEFTNDRAKFVSAICDVLDPIAPVLKFVLADADFTFFVNADKTDAITLKGAEGYAYGIIPLLEAINCEGIMTPAEYYAAVEADNGVLLTSIIDPLLDRVDVILENPAEEILEILPNIIYFVNSNGVDTVVKNTLNAVYSVLAAIEPIAKLDLYEIIGIDLATIDFNWLVDKLLEILKNTGYDFKVEDINAIAELTVGTLTEYTSLNGKTAYKMVYAPDGGIQGGKAEMVTVIERLVIKFITDEANQKIVVKFLQDKLGMSAEATPYVEALIKLLADTIDGTSLGMQSALATVYYVFYGVDQGVGNTADGYRDLNAAWKEAIGELKEENSNAGAVIEEILGWDIFEDVLDIEEGLAPNGFIKFFQKIAEWFRSIGEWFKKLFSFGK